MLRRTFLLFDTRLFRLDLVGFWFDLHPPSDCLNGTDLTDPMDCCVHPAIRDSESSVLSPLLKLIKINRKFMTDGLSPVGKVSSVCVNIAP